MRKPKTLIIGVSGKMRHGKDVIGSYLVDSYDFKRGSFAEEVKRICMYYSITPDYSNWNEYLADEVLEGAVTSEQVEEFMQKVEAETSGGQSWTPLTYEDCFVTKPDYARLKMQAFAQGMRNLHEPCWVNYLMKKCVADGGRWVISDLRYQNEAFAIGAIENNQIWRVRRPIPAPVGGDHISETNLDEYPFEVYIDNDGSLSNLYRKVDKIMKALENDQQPFAKGKEVY